MALILAIEPDRRQASHLAAMVRGRLRAEFIVGESAERALAALGDRVPDLVLTTALLSPKDETQLTDRLRALDGKAAHVQTLTIPVLASPAHTRRSAKGVLSSLLGDKSDDEPIDGCDPAMFAEQCKEYLDRAARERVDRHEFEGPTVTVTAPAAAPEPAAAIAESPRSIAATEASIAVEEATPARDNDPNEIPSESSPEVPSESSSIAATLPSVVRRSIRGLLDAYEAEAPLSLMAAMAALEHDEPTVKESQSIVPAEAVDALEPGHAAEPAADNTTEWPIEMDLSAAIDTTASVAADVTLPQDTDEAVMVYELDTSLALDSFQDLAAQQARSWPILEELTAEAPSDSATAVSEPAAPAPAVSEPVPAAAVSEPAAPAPAVAATPERDDRKVKSDDWSDILESLRREVQTVGWLAEKPVEPSQPATEQTPAPTEQAAVVAEPPVQAEPSVQAESPVQAEPPAEPPASGTRRRGRKPTVQDEWGFFDPDRAGFAALLAKLEEITEEDTRKPKRA